MKFALAFSVSLFDQRTPTRRGLARVKRFAWLGLGNAGSWSLRSYRILSRATAPTAGALRKA
jgi:hypothetical protein